MTRAFSHAAPVPHLQPHLVTSGHATETCGRRGAQPVLGALAPPVAELVPSPFLSLPCGCPCIPGSSHPSVAEPLGLSVLPFKGFLGIFVCLFFRT